MIEKLETIKQYGWDFAGGGIIGEKAPSDIQLMNKINEIIDYINDKEKENGE